MSNSSKKVDVLNLEGEIIRTFDSVTAAAKEFNVNHCTILYWIGTQRIRDDYTFKFHNENDCASERNYQYYTFRPVREKGVDREKYNVLKYEVINKRVSITPCPYKEHPKPMVGSCACMSCKSNRGRDRKTHEVACNRINQQ